MGPSDQQRRGLDLQPLDAVGEPVATAFAVGILGALLVRGAADSPAITPAAVEQLNFDNVNFVTDDHVQSVLSATTATPAQVAEGVRINADARLRALRTSLLVLAGLALLAIFPARRMPKYRPGDLPVGYPEGAGRLAEEPRAATT